MTSTSFTKRLRTPRGRHPRLLTVILAGGEGGRLGALTERRPKPAMPFAGQYRLIDFPLSHCAHSGLDDVWIVEQYQPFRLNQHLANGRPWDLDRLHGGLRVLPPYQVRGDAEEEGFAQGNADALWRNRAFIRDFDPDLLLVLSADHIYRMDFRDLIESHLSHEKPPAVTLVHTAVPPGDNPKRFGNVRLNQRGRVTEFAYKPDEPLQGAKGQPTQVTAEVFLYDAPTVLTALEELAAAKQKAKPEQDDEAPLQDFGHELLPHLVEQGTVYGWELNGYWRDVGTVDSYFAAQREFLASDPPFALDDPGWPILTFGPPRAPARFHAGCQAADSLISPGCEIAGQVVGSVLAPGVTVEAGARVRDSILLENVTVRSGANVERAVVDEGVEIPAKAKIGSASKITVQTQEPEKL